MLVREIKWAYSLRKVNLGGTAVRIYRPEEWVILLFGIFVYKGVDIYESKISFQVAGLPRKNYIIKFFDYIKKIKKEN